MGWCSGTIVFDGIVEALLYPGRVDHKEVIKKLITSLWELDWDCEFDSKYITHPLVKEAFIELDPELERHYKEIEEWERNKEK
jgi:hypothetical protein